MSDNCLQVIKCIDKIISEPVIKPFQCDKYQLCDRQWVLIEVAVHRRKLLDFS